LFGGAEDLADADLAGALQDVISGEAEESEAGDDDGEGGEEAEGGAEAGVGFVLLVEGFVEEVIVEGVAGEVAVPGFLYGGERLVGCAAGELYRIVVPLLGLAKDAGRLDRISQSLLVEVREDPDDVEGVADVQFCLANPRSLQAVSLMRTA